MKEFRVTVRGDSAGVKVLVSRKEIGQSEFVEIDMNPKEFDEFAIIVARERIRRGASSKKCG